MVEQLNRNPDGDIILDSIAIESMKWLKTSNEELFRKYTIAIMQDANKNFERTHIVYNSFDLLRELINTVQKLQNEEYKTNHPN